MNHIKVTIRKVDRSFMSNPFSSLSSTFTHAYTKELKTDIVFYFCLFERFRNKKFLSTQFLLQADAFT